MRTLKITVTGWSIKTLDLPEHETVSSTQLSWSSFDLGASTTGLNVCLKGALGAQGMASGVHLPCPGLRHV